MSFDSGLKIRKGVDYNFIRREYGEQVRAAGGQPVFLDAAIDPEVAAELCDGIVISGGEDIDSSLYGKKQLHTHGIEPAERTTWEIRLINACDKQGKRILGVCYGMQLLNLHYGGSLYQDIKTELGTHTDHGSPGGSVMQRVNFADDFLSFSKDDSVQTAHRHHQAVRDIAKGFKAVATTEDGIVEAIAGHGHYGIQWHAESDGTAPTIYGSFVALCAGETAPGRVLAPSPEAA
jgi:putative glutamine amidotransferase